ncbi:MAG: hypothetical protein JO141_04530 [Bradyrhizobium sp.]|nr:hypothetical protein [Bradyrhizobium sp.]
MADAAPAKDELKTFGLSSERRIDALVNRFVQLGYVEQLPSELDGRVGILMPTPKMNVDRPGVAALSLRA